MTKSNFLKRLLPFLLAFLLVIPSLTAFAATDDQTTGGTGDGFTWQKVDDADIEGLTPAHEVENNSDINTDGYVPVGEEVRVSIFLDGKSTMDAGYDIETIGYNTDAKSYRSQVLAQQKALEKKISSEVLGGAELNVVWNLTLITNIISAYVPSSKIEAIKALDGVKDVVVEIQYEAPAPVVSDEPNMSNASEMTGTQPVWSNGYTGAGSLVAIIDTGLDVEHQSFDPDAFDYAIEKTGKEVDLLEKEDIAAVLDQLNIKERIPEAGEGDLWLNSKVPFAANYVDWDLDVTHANDTEGEHGSHVAGISAANRYIKSGDTFVSALDTVYTQGNAPDAQVMVMKVFGKGGGASPTDYFAAIEDSIVLGADSVNLSLGSPYAGFTTDSAYADVFAALEESNTVMTVSAGNNGTWAEQTAYGYLYSDDVNFHTGGDPGAYRDSFTVASVDNDGFTGAYLKLGEDMIFYTETSGKNNPMVTIAGNYDYVYIDGPGVVTDDNDAITSDQFAALGARLEHVIAFCNRGTSSFFQKANAAMGQKAAACVIVNNQPGTISMDLTGYNYTNPCVSITKADGQLLKDQATSTEVIEIDGTNVTVYFGKIQVGSDVAVIDYDAEYYTMSDFSSWGVPGDLTLKPEITAPGGNIYSLNGYHLDENGNPAGGHDAYENMSGTSMAAPQMAGITAVLKQYIRENDLVAKTGMTERQLSISLLMSTAAPMIEADSESYYSVLSQGAGLVNLEAATNAKTYILMDKSATVSAADGKVKAELGDDPERTASYSVAFTMNNMTDEDVDVELGADFFTQNVDQGFLDTWTAPLENVSKWFINGKQLYKYDFNGDAKYDSLDAQALLDYVVGNRETVNDIDYADLDEDGDIDTHDAYLALNNHVTIPANGEIDVEIKFDIPGIAEYDDNGNYVEGYIFATECNTEEGVIGVTHSIPVLGYYGSWSEPDMTDVGSLLEYMYGEVDVPPYMYLALSDAALQTETYLLTYPNGGTFAFGGNPYMYDDVYMPERNAISSSATLSAYQYALIRNAAGTLFEAVDDAGNVKFTKEEIGEYIGAFYYANQRKWYNTSTSSSIKFKPTGIAEGTQLSLNFKIAPAYYQNEDGSINWDDLAESATISVPAVVDNTEPAISNIELVKDDEGNITAVKVTASDNEYVAALGLYTEANDELAFTSCDLEVGKGESHEYTLEVDSSKVAPHMYIFVGDYAVNEAIYEINLNTEELDGELTINIVQDELKLIVGKTVKLDVEVTPWGINDSFTWTSSDEAVATVDAKGYVTGLTTGTVTITATSKKDPTKSDTATINVMEFDKVLNGIVWDESGNRFVSEFNLNTLPNYTKLSDHIAAGPIDSIAYDNIFNIMYAASYDSDKKTSALYLMDPYDGYAVEKIGDANSGDTYTDLAMSPGLSVDYDKDVVVSIDGQYVDFIDAATGKAFGYYRFSAPLVGMAYEGTGKYPNTDYYYDWYFFVDVNGDIHETGFMYGNPQGTGDALYWFGDNVDGNIGFSTGTAYYNSAYISYEEDETENFYWSRFDESEGKVDMIVFEISYDTSGNTQLGEADLIGSFDNDVWPVGGLYEEKDIPREDDGSIACTIDKAMFLDKLSCAEVETVKAPEVKGSIDAVVSTGTSVERAIKIDDEINASGVSSATIEITADDDGSEELFIHNGLYELTWDPEIIELVKYESEADMKSALEEDGKLVFGYVDEEGFKIENTVLELTFKHLDRTQEGTIVITTKDNGCANPGSVDKYVFKPEGGIDSGAGVTGITLDPASAKIAIDDTLQLNPAINPVNAMDPSVTYTSSDEAIATVDENGVVTGKAVGKATITAKTNDGGFEATCEVTVLFKDVTDSSKYYYKPVYWAAENGITKGYTSGENAGKFGVGLGCTRQEFILFIYRLAGTPDVDISDINSRFSDVSKLSATFKKAIAWGVNEGIIKGYSDGTFGTGKPVIRKDAMIMIYRYAGKPTPSEEGIAAANKFTDVKGKFKPTSDTFKAIAWAAGEGITNGYTSGQYKGMFGCDLECLREQLVTFLYRMEGKPEVDY